MEKKNLSDVVKKTGLSSHAKTVWTMHPLLEQMALAFVSYVGMYSLANNGQPLACVGLKEALTKYKSSEEIDEKEAVGAFTRTLIAYSAESFAQKVVVQTDRGDIAWSPFVCGQDDFLASYPDSKVSGERVESRIPATVANAFMMTKIIPHALLDQDSLSELLNDVTANV